MYCGYYISKLLILLKSFRLGLETVMGKICCKCLDLLGYQPSESISLRSPITSYEINFERILAPAGIFHFWRKRKPVSKSRNEVSHTWWRWMKTCQWTREHYKSTWPNIAWIWNSWLCLPLPLIFCYIHWHLSTY